MRKLFENWYPAYCSSHCYKYFLCLWESIFCDTRKTRRQNSHLFKKKILLCLGSVNWLFLPAQHPFFLLLVMHNYFWGKGTYSSPLPQHLTLGCAQDRGCQSVYFISLDRVMCRCLKVSELSILLKPFK